MMTIMNLYHGDNGIHEFWESSDSSYLIIRNHGEKRWMAMKVAGDYCFGVFGSAMRAQTIAGRIRRHYGIHFTLNTKRRWYKPRKNAKHMLLIQQGA